MVISAACAGLLLHRASATMRARLTTFLRSIDILRGFLVSPIIRNLADQSPSRSRLPPVLCACYTKRVALLCGDAQIGASFQTKGQDHAQTPTFGCSSTRVRTVDECFEFGSIAGQGPRRGSERQ